jgi:hypothetical protein
MKVSALREERKIKVRVLDEHVNVTYNPFKLTVDLEERMRDQAGGIESMAAPLFLVEVVQDWDLMEDDGTPVPLSVDRLKEVPVKLLVILMQGMVADALPSRAEGLASKDGSPQAETSEKRPSGSFS